MDLGAFSMSLAVSDIHESKNFYNKLGFIEVGGDIAQNWLILRNGEVTIGLFQDMFEKNILTFNPGWDAEAKPKAEFTDIRELQRNFQEKGIKLSTVVDETGTGPASFTLEDPDGNLILFDQHR